jgi:hypothetical protein
VHPSSAVGAGPPTHPSDATSVDGSDDATVEPEVDSDLDLAVDRERLGEDATTLDRRARLGGRLVTSVRFAGPALLVYAAVRIIGVITLWIFARHAGVPVFDVLGKHFDSVWYTNIAQHGYDYVLHHNSNGTLAPTDLAFFPLYPALIAATTAITPLSAPMAGVLLAWLGGLVAAWGIFAVGSHLHDRRTGVLLVALWGVLPHAVVESMAYTETIFTAFAAWALLAVLRRQWLTASGLTVLAGLVRPTATPLIGAVCIAALIAGIRRRDGWRPWVAIVVAPLGYLGYLAWVAVKLGRLDGYLYIQKHAWNLSFDGGGDTARTFRDVLTRGQSLSYYSSALVIVVAIALLVLSVLDRQPPALLVYSFVMIVMTVGVEHYFWAKGRYLIPAFPLLLPIAAGLARSKPRAAVVVLVLLALISAWYGTYQSLIWPHSP